MLFSNSYRTITNTSEALFKEKGSKFYAFAKPLHSEVEFKLWLHQIKQLFPDATHHCYALVLHPDKSFQKCADDGEPNNTAGKPILRAIISMDLTNIAVIVVRYFGGTMLGVPGLINAYQQAAVEALKQAKIEEIEIEDHYLLKCEFIKEGEAHRYLKTLDAKIVRSEYDDGVKIAFRLARSKASKMNDLKEQFYFLTIEDRTEG